MFICQKIIWKSRSNPLLHQYFIPLFLPSCLNAYPIFFGLPIFVPAPFPSPKPLFTCHPAIKVNIKIDVKTIFGKAKRIVLFAREFDCWAIHQRRGWGKVGGDNKSAMVTKSRKWPWANEVRLLFLIISSVMNIWQNPKYNNPN